MRRALFALLLLPALAAPTATPARADEAPRTKLRLAESAEIAVRPDELHATLAVEARASTAAAAQAAVNRAMAAALERAHAVPGLVASTGGYQVWRSGERSTATPAWQASQTLELTAKDAAPLLELAGTLQGQGLAVRQLGWRVSRDLYRSTRERATEQAVQGLTARAERMAGLLGLAFERFASVELDAQSPPSPRFRAMPAPMAAAASAPPPVVEAEEVRIGASVSGEALLRPR